MEGAHWELRCDCGYRIRSADRDELAVPARDHALGAHGVVFTAAEVLALARPVIEGEVEL